MFFFIRIAIFFLLFLSPLFAQEHITLRLKWLHQFQFAGFYMAKEKGYYKDVGLDVDIQEVNPKENYLDFLNKTPASYAVMDSGGILQRLKGAPIVTLGAIFQQSPNVLITLKESNIQDINQLKGKRLMANLEEQDAPILVAIQKEGLSTIDFTLLPFSYNYNDLIDGKVDVISTYITDTPYVLKSKGLKYNIIDPLSYGINFYGDMIYTSQEEAQKNPLRAQKFLDSSLKGWEYALNNVDETIAIIKNKYASKMSYDHLEYEAQMSKQMIMAERIPLGQVNVTRVKEIANYYITLGLASKTDNLKNFIFGTLKSKEGNGDFLTLLSHEEKNYLASNTQLSIGFIQEYPPFSYTDAKGNKSGVILDVITAIEEYSNLKLTPKSLPWNEVMQGMKDRSIDMFFGQESEERRVFSTFTSPVSSFSYAVFSHDPTLRTHTLGELKGKKVLVIKGFAISEAIKAIEGVELITKANSIEALEALMRKEADCFVDNLLATNYHIKTFSFTGIYLSGILQGKEQYAKIGVRNDKPILYSIIQKAINQIPKERLDAIQNRWILHEFNKTDQKSIILTAKEKQWIASNPIVRVANDPAYPPYDFYENDKASGFSIELFESLCKIIGITPVFITQEWDGAVKAFEQSTLDVLTSVVPTTQNAKFSIYSKPYAQNVEVVALSKKHVDINTLNDLQNKRLAMPSGYENIDKLKENGLKFDHISSIDTLDSLRLILTNKADYTIEALPVIDYFTTKYGITNIKINSLPPIGNYNTQSRNFHFAFHSHDVILKTLVDKALDVTTKEDITKLQRKWFSGIALSNENMILLSDEEKQWLFEHPTLSIANDSDWAPYDFTQNGKAMGYSVDLFHLIGKKLGVNFKFVQANTWSQLLENFKNGKIDILHASARTPQREQYTLFGKPYIFTQTVLVHQKGAKNFQTLEEAIKQHSKVAVAKGYWTSEAIKAAFPSLHVEEFESTLAALKAVSTGQTSLFLGTEKPIRYLANLHQIQNIELSPTSFFSNSDYEKLYFGVQKNNPILHSILEKTFVSLPNDEILSLQQKWFGDVLVNDTAIKVGLNEDEISFLKEHPTLKLGVETFYPPYDFVDNDGAYKGLSHDILNAIFKDTKNINFDKISQNDWKLNIAKLKNKELDLVLSVTSKVHSDDILMSIPYMSVPYMIFGTKNSTFVESLADLPNKKVGYVDKAIDISYLQATYPDVHFTNYFSVKELFKALNDGSLEYFLSNIPSINNTLKQQTLSDIKLVGKTEETFRLSFAIRKDWPELLGIINKGLKGMSEAEKNKIYDNWFKLDIQTATDYSLLWKSTLFFGLALLLFGAWNRSLSAEISRRKEIEAKLLIAQQKAENANRAKSEFLSNMSHEIRTPMNAVIGFAELTSKMELPKVAAQNIQTILRSAKALISIINDILDLSKIEAGKLKVQKEPIDIKDLADELHNIFYVKIEEKGLKCQIDFDEKIPNALFIDEIRIRQILINLVGNAIKFTDKGHINVSFKVIPNSSRDSTLDLHVSVQDSGIGINDADRDKIFEVFEQQSGQDNRKFGGTGLGLSISQKLAHLMGGEIVLESPKEGGSIFTLKLYHVEIALTNPKANKFYAHHKTSFHQELVLAVDDIEDNLVLIETLLQGYGFEVISTNDPEKSIELAKQYLPKLIFMDIKMPKMDGYEVTDILKNLPETKDIPIIAVSASVLGEKEEAMRRGLFDAFVSKPINTRELEEAIGLFVEHTENNDELYNKEEQLDFHLSMPKEEKKVLIDYLEKMLTQGDLSAIEESVKKIASKNILNKRVLEELENALHGFDLIKIETLLRQIITSSKEEI